MISKQQFASVFRIPDIPSESEAQIISTWLFSHQHTAPSQRTKSAIRTLTDETTINILIEQYISQIRLDSFEIEVHDIKRLAMMKEYFMFPMNYLQMTEIQYQRVERAVNGIIRSKLQSTEGFLGEHEEFISSLGIDVGAISKFHHEQQIKQEINKHARKWNCSFTELVKGDPSASKALLSLRINEIFEIVSNYPQSIPCLLDIKNFIQPEERSKLVTSFIRDSQKNILHAGTNTVDIIVFYTLTINSFLCIDPRGVLLDNCSRPIRRYLRDRPDTIKNIVQALLETGSPQNKLSALTKELSKEQEKQTSNLTLTWTPDPIDALPDFKKKDIIESLMSIFENKETFVTELVEVFAQKLLSLEEHGLHEIMVKLEQLRPRFEEADLNNVDVMVNDIRSSSILDKKVHRMNSDISEKVSFFVLSHLYWPEMEEASMFKLPQAIQVQIDSYKEQFTKLQKGRCINVVNAGVVTLEIDIDGTVTKFEVAPARAFAINLFNGRDKVSIDEAVSELQMDEDLAKESLDFWCKQRVLKEISIGTFQSVESL
ncbi:hypothetical protein WICPIJ_001719 [Wickerhamomyces pijperi]|uniref:Cullin family profile domain-containing protein n=1 Tax=Wickerhamomyces pijperi TaxID=599730 RepID=A0A9P8QB59_WICPI|nr:hypothetical protein WICPIJ_001719 [Wickerhamomyces pijperi]